MKLVVEWAAVLFFGICFSTGCIEMKTASASSGSGGSSGTDGDAPTTALSFTYFEVATQVTAASLSSLQRLDSATVATGTGTAILLNSQLVQGGTLSDAGFPPHVDGGTVVGTMHGMCTNLGGGLSLSPDGPPGRVGQCEQAMNIYGQGQIIVSGLIEQDQFEAGATQTLAVTGGTGAYQGAYGQLHVTQLTFPGIVKQDELTFKIP